MTPKTPVVVVVRLVLEAATPLSISSGFGDGVDDSRLARRPDGLPFLPATAVAGVLRQAVGQVHGEDAMLSLFGFASGSDGAASRVQFSHGRLHDSLDRPVEGFPADDSDPLIGPLLNEPPLIRRRVRIGHRGVSPLGGHFDRAVLPAGHRFSLELSLWCADLAEAAKDRAVLLGLLNSSAFRVGGLTHSGLGRLKIVCDKQGAIDVPRAWLRTFDLRKPGDQGAFSALGTGVAPQESLFRASREDLESAALAGRSVVGLDLAAEGCLRVGDGHTTRHQRGRTGKPADDLPFDEPRVEFDAGRKCRVLSSPRLVIPATSIKGPLSHRVAFHDHRLRKCWSSKERVAGADTAQSSVAVKALFGSVAGSDGGAAGAIYIDDLWLDGHTDDKGIAWANHVSIDRFTGGVREGALFSAESLFQPKLRFEIEVDLERAQRNGADQVALDALRLAVEDLCGGRLPIGADSAGGLGYLEGTAAWKGRALALSALEGGAK